MQLKSIYNHCLLLFGGLLYFIDKSCVVKLKKWPTGWNDEITGLFLAYLLQTSGQDFHVLKAITTHTLDPEGNSKFVFFFLMDGVALSAQTD